MPLFVSGSSKESPTARRCCSWLAWRGGLRFRRSLPEHLEHAGAAGGTFAFDRRASVLQTLLSGAGHFLLRLALHAIGFGLHGWWAASAAALSAAALSAAALSAAALLAARSAVTRLSVLGGF